MRIQHNIPAMNAYRNYNANTKALQGNLQKLSSGYKINKAGDDAAGLAISEKMRAQITGLEVAQKNAKDGISLVQTAEGAMTEIHTMLNRMFSLAEQSANGTYDDEVDRAQLQNEFQKLTDEIDRIADSTNFNGKKLLDGTLAGSGSSGTSGTKTAAKLEIADALKLGAGAAYSKTDATKQKYTGGTAFTATAAGDIAEMTLTYRDESGNAQDITIQMKGGAATTDKIQYKIGSGSWTDSSKTTSTAGVVTAAESDDILKEALETTDFAKIFTIDNTTDTKLTFEAKTEGETKVEILKGTYTNKVGTTAASALTYTEAKGEAAYESLNLANVKTWSADSTNTNGSTDVEKTVFTIDGQKFAFANKGELDAAQKALGNDVVVIEQNGAAKAALNNNDATKLKETMKIKLGYDAAEVDGTTNTQLNFKPVEKAGASTSSNGSSGGLRLRVGDSTNSYDDITVEIKSLKASALSGTIKEGKGAGETHTLDKLNVSTDADADIAMGTLKDMINYVSTERGTLGATQNRLDHTINNLSTMQENIQDAEATIRDVDVAEEMMKYTKNNILVQSAQAMLAQANQLPQGVLQLLG